MQGLLFSPWVYGTSCGMEGVFVRVPVLLSSILVAGLEPFERLPLLWALLSYAGFCGVGFCCAFYEGLLSFDLALSWRVSLA